MKCLKHLMATLLGVCIVFGAGSFENHADGGDCNVCNYEPVDVWRVAKGGGAYGYRVKSGGVWVEAPNCIQNIESNFSCPSFTGLEEVGKKNFWRYKGSVPVCDTQRMGNGPIKMTITGDREELPGDSGTQYACTQK